MNQTTQSICNALKKIAAQFKNPLQPVSFLLLTGRSQQGKTALLKQSSLSQFADELDHQAQIYTHEQHIVLELGETWLNHCDCLLADAFKEFNRCHPALKISGIVFCVDSTELLQTEPLQLVEQCKTHTELLARVHQALGYQVDTALMMTKLDALAGFCEFFQSAHEQTLNEPLGFSLEDNPDRRKLFAQFNTRFDQMIESLSHEIISKLHPARSSAKRTLIREFPLQLASLQGPLQTLLQNIRLYLSPVKFIYFTSAEQGGQTLDRLNKKIQHEYALCVPDKFPQSNNFRAFFITDALNGFLKHCEYTARLSKIPEKLAWGLTLSALSVCLIFLGFSYLSTAQKLDETSQELIAWETLNSDPSNKEAALYHLSRAEAHMQSIHNGPVGLSLIKQMKTRLSHQTSQKLENNFIPDLVHLVESIMTDPAHSPLERYQALKIYLMLGDKSHFNKKDILNWYKLSWKQNNGSQMDDKPVLLLQTILDKELKPLLINRQLVTDVRNYLNALPPAYLYYSLAKGDFDSRKIPVNVEGFDLAAINIPVYFTKSGFQNVILSLPAITTKLQNENWVLERRDLGHLQAQLEQAYCYDYASWWQNFTRRTMPQHYQGFQQGRELMTRLQQDKAIPKLIALIQENTSPELSSPSPLFNQKIANAFTSLNLMSHSAAQELSLNIAELERFLTTLALVKNHEKTVFDITRSRFQGDAQTDPLSALYNLARQLPEPFSTWSTQIADDTWYIFISESRDYLNNKWKKDVYQRYQETIAKRYPFDALQKEEVSLADFNEFFSPGGTLNGFINEYLKPFVDTTHAQWSPKEVNGYMLPISAELINELIRANVISNMFFTKDSAHSKIEFSLQKISLDPVISTLELSVGQNVMSDNQDTESTTFFNWPEKDAKLILSAIEGNQLELEEKGIWGFFKLLHKMNVLVDNQDSSSLQILFEVNGNSGRYLLKTQNQINPFSPGILTGFNLKKEIA